MTAVVLLVLAAGPHAYDAEIRAAVVDTANVYPVPDALVRAIIQNESAFEPRAVSRAGALGLMQVMPFNAPKVGVDAKQLLVPRVNILAGVRLLAVLLRHYQGDVVAALVAYNAGPRPREARVPANGETPAYVLRILRTWRAFEAERDAGR